MAISRPDEDKSQVERLQLVETLRQSGIGAADETPEASRIAPSRPGRIGSWLLLGALLATALWAAGRSYFPASGETVAVRILHIATPAADAGAGEAALPEAGLEATGYVIAERTATVSSSIVGRVADVLVAVGDSVEAGEIVARLDDRAQRIELDRLKIDLETAFANLKARDAELALAESELRRGRYLVERDVANPVLLEERQNRVDIVAAERAAVALAVEMTRTRMALQEQILDELAIRAPYDGLVTHVTANPGEIVSPASGGGTFTRSGICTIIDLGSIAVSVQINEKFLPRIGVGDPVEMTFPALGDRTIDGIVARIAPFADRQTGTIDILIAPDAAWREILRPGIRALAQFSTPAISASPAADHGIIPAAAIFRDGGGDHVFVYENGHARRSPLDGRRLENGDFRLESPRRSGLPVIIWSATPLEDGKPVEIR